MAGTPWQVVWVIPAASMLIALSAVIYVNWAGIARWYRILRVMALWNCGIPLEFDKTPPTPGEQSTMSPINMNSAIRLVEWASHRVHLFEIRPGYDEARCPLCLKSLFRALKEEEASPSPSPPPPPPPPPSAFEAGADLEAGDAALLPRRPPQAAHPPWARVGEETPGRFAVKKEPAPDPRVDPRRSIELVDRVLALRCCGHLFHRKCLAAWCLRWRYHCPVCRATYYREKAVGCSKK